MPAAPRWMASDSKVAPPTLALWLGLGLGLGPGLGLGLRTRRFPCEGYAVLGADAPMSLTSSLPAPVKLQSLSSASSFEVAMFCST